MATIRQLRQAQGWTQVDLAARIDVAPSSIANWESGRTMPRVPQLRDLARVFDVQMDSIELVEKPAGKAIAALSV